jgi:ABC-2 type transport system permease protein
MNKTLLIIKREYLTRVRKKTFLLSTFLTPLLFAALLGVIIAVTVSNKDNESIAVVDNTGVFTPEPDSAGGIQFVADPTVTLTNFEQKGYTAVLVSPNHAFNKDPNWRIFSKKNFGVMANEQVNRKLRKEYEDHLLSSSGLDTKKIDSIRNASGELRAQSVILDTLDKQKSGNSGVAYGVGYGAGFLIYITLLIYGSMVMRGVMEEKTNRIAEVIVSSVKPFQLMMGKIIGIGAVGLTQFFLWIILLLLFTTIAGAMIPAEVLAQVESGNAQMPGGNPQASEAMRNFAKAQNQLASVNWPLIIFCFLYYFLFGYLFYAALFAAIGSAVNDDSQDVQTLMLPVTMPIIVALIIMINAIIHPEGSLATWSSLVPFFSPIIMMARIPFGVPGTVPWWQLITSMLLLGGGFVFTTWLSAKIYRTGILLYGKKITWKEMWKWGIRG